MGSNSSSISGSNTPPAWCESWDDERPEAEQLATSPHLAPSVEETVYRRVGTQTPIGFVRDEEKGIFQTVASSGDAYNCHSFAWHRGQPDEDDNAYTSHTPRWDNTVLDDMQQARRLGLHEPLLRGDVLVHGWDANGNRRIDRGEDQHSAIVTQVRGGKAVLVMDKLGMHEVTEHDPRNANRGYRFAVSSDPRHIIEWYRPREPAIETDRRLEFALSAGYVPTEERLAAAPDMCLEGGAQDEKAQATSTGCPLPPNLPWPLERLGRLDCWLREVLHWPRA